MKFKLQKSNEIARKNIIIEKEKREKELNQHINPIDVSIGDFVYLKNENRKKLDPLYLGPFIITNIKDPNCTIKNKHTHKTTTVHKNRLIKN